MPATGVLVGKQTDPLGAAGVLDDIEKAGRSDEEQRPEE
jgi:hypothetical protein